MNNLAYIELKFCNLTKEQAEHILEAYGEARGMSAAAWEMPAPSPLTAAQGIPAPGAPAGNGEADETGAPPASHDNRGVPFNATFHNPAFKADGSWKRRRNHDKDAADAFEAQFLGKPASGAAQAAPQTAVNTAAPTPSATPAASAAPASTVATAVAAPASAAPSPGRYVPNPQEYTDKWTELCRTGKVTGEHQQFIQNTYKFHPCAAEIVNDVDTRTAIWIYFGHWANGFKAF